MSEANLVRLLVFRVGNLVCAAEVDAVREILPRLPTTRIPGAPPVVAGLANVRGTLVTVVEGWRALGQPKPPVDQSDGAGSTVLLEVGASRRLEGHPGQAGQLLEGVLQAPQDLEGALDLLGRLGRVQAGEAGQGGDRLGDLGVVLHGARAERVEAQVDREVAVGQAGVVAHQVAL